MNEEKEVIATVIHNGTGEILDRIYAGDRVYHNNTNTSICYDFNKEKNFVKLFDWVNKLRKYLTANEFTIAMSLADFVCYEDCILRKGGHHNGKILTIKDLAVLMDIKYETLRKVISSLVKKEVLGIHKTGCNDKSSVLVKAITVNPYIYMRGSNVNKTILAFYEKSKFRPAE